jgi:transposase
MNYPSDVTDAQWDLIKDHFNTGNYGTSRKYSPRALVNAVFYIVKTGCQWRFCQRISLLIRLYTVLTGALRRKEFGKK